MAAYSTLWSLWVYQSSSGYGLIPVTLAACSLLFSLARSSSTSLQDLPEIFHDTVRSGGNDTSKPKVVIGAEMGAFPSALMPGYRIFDERRENTVTGKWQNLDCKDFADCDRKEATMGPCSDPPLYQFGNTGFIMGEARDILRVLAGTTGYSNDQERIIVLHAHQSRRR